MTLTNKDYYVKGTRWWWYSIFLIFFNIICLIVLGTIVGVLGFIEDDEELLIPFIFSMPSVVLVIILTIIFIKNTLKREKGFSMAMLIVISIFYFFAILLLIIPFVMYFELGDFTSVLIVMPFIIGPLMLLINFIVSHMYHKKGIIPADKKDKKLKWLGIVSIIVSLFSPVILIAIIVFGILLKPSSYKNQGIMKECKKCHERIDKNAEFCPKCGAKQDEYCKKCGALISENMNFCVKCGEKI